MGSGRPNGNPAPRTKWQQVLDLGEQLLRLARQPFTQPGKSQAGIAAQRELIEQTTARLLAGPASLWLSRRVVRAYEGKWRQQPENEAAEEMPDTPWSPLMQKVLRSHQLCCSEGGESETCWEAVDLEALQAAGSEARAVAAPLLLLEGNGQATDLLGVLQVERASGLPFEVREVELIDGLAAQAALALQAGLQWLNEQWRLEQLSLVRQVSAQIADVRDLDELSRRVATLIQQTFDYYYVAIFTLQPGADILHFRASAGPVQSGAEGSAAPTFSPSLVVHMGQGIIGHVAQAGCEILANDVRQESLYRHLDVLPETLSEVALPLKIEDRLLGVLDVQSDQLAYFDETDLLVLRALAGNIAFAVEGAHLYTALQRRAGQLSSIYEVSSAITSILDHESLLNQVVELIRQRFGYPFVHLFTVHPGRRKILYEAGSGALSQALCEEGFSYDLDDPVGLVPWVARRAETALVNDVAQDPRYSASRLPPDETLSELTVPLVFGGEVLGVLDVQSDRLDAFNDDDRFLFEALAGNIAIAMRNAQLYRSEVWRRQVADGMREVAGLLSADVDLDRVLEAILSELERTLPLDAAAIWLAEEENQETGQSPFLHLAALRGPSLVDLDLEVGLSPEDVIEFNASPDSGIAPEHASLWLLEALLAEHPLIRVPESPFDPLGAALNFPSDYSAIAAPLRVGEHNLGILTLAHRTAGRYGSEARAMTAAFASYAAVAIENTRLYEAAHDQAWVSTVLLQVAEATQSLTDLNELLATVTQITPTLVGVRACLLYIVDDDGMFVPAAASGLNAEQQTEFEHWRFAPGEVLALDHMSESQEAVILHGDMEDLNLTSIFFPAGRPKSTLHTELFVLVPLLARGEVLGAFLVDYSVSSYGGDGSQGVDAFFDERLAIIQGIAHQTAVAVENIRLIKSQREEAYVSVALLQVAQAVVSSNDLKEALGAIVRITPILVGVERAAVFMWDKAYQLFRLVQSYGISREASELHYKRGQFPILDAVYEEGNVLAYPLTGGEEVFSNAPDDWSFLIPPDIEEVQEYLTEEACLLLAFPLSVKGEPLGVFIVEEPHPNSEQGVGSGKANRRLRSKRMEIITGISQQAALAIQNDLLQRQMVERERLEREMQLAREIQRTFLPQTLPDLPGWDLRVCWRTAHEVGGDFYDYFALPGRRFGLVIADVADKGMPAALFMTLVRTLVRAAVQQAKSPARVLERVNNLLVPDAPQGMFVTLAYAVLSLDTGELELANAGHNPPLWVRCNPFQLERLHRGGMALGVIEGNRIEDRKLLLEPGDCLVMYTDGVTEAFSPDGDLFGEERLLATVEAAAQCSAQAAETEAPAAGAQAMLEAIDQAVVDFIGEAARSDDLTLLVLKRLPPR